MTGESPVEIETGNDPTAAVIWLHGLGADGNDFAPIVPELGLPPRPAVRFVFPHAPFRPVTINHGYVMRAWYDVGFGPRGFAQDAEHIGESVRLVHGLIAHEQERGVPVRRIVLAGFSQGGTVALHAALRHPQRLAGVVALSAPAPFLEDLLREADAANRDVPILLAHGRRDPIVAFAVGEGAGAALAARGYEVDWRAYDIEHTVSLAEVQDIGRFLARVLA